MSAPPPFSSYELALEVAGVGVWEWEIGADQVRRTGTLERLLGGPIDEAPQAFWERVHPADRPILSDAIESAPKTGGYKADYRVVHPDGKVRWLHDEARVVDGERFVGAVRDVTVERQSNEALRSSEARNRAFFERAAVGTMEVDVATERLLRANARMEEITGYSEAELRTMTLCDLSHPDDHPGVKRLYQRLGSGDADHYGSVRRYVRKDGTLVWVQVEAGLVYDAHDRPEFTVAIVQEIEDRVEAERRMTELNARLQKAVEERTEAMQKALDELSALTYSVSHDMRAPVRAMAGHARILIEDAAGRLLPNDLDHLRRIERNAVRMGQQVDDLLNYARLGRQEMRHDSVNLSRLARGVVEKLRRSGAASDEARFEIAPSMRVNGDASMLETVLTCLLDNACKFVAHGEAPKVEVGQEEDGEVWVRDAGIGFDMAFANKLFQPFERLHRYEDYPGTGIGLANARRVVERHGGRITAHAEPGKGATFRFKV